MSIKCFMLENTDQKNAEGFRLFRRTDTGEVKPYLNNGDEGTPVGAMWWCDWLDRHGYVKSAEVEKSCPNLAAHPDSYFPDVDGRVLAVKTPGGIWIIDSRASNCTMPSDNAHRCWIRHGEAPNITVDKNGVTCGAGAGSIQCGGYHGFLRNGELVQ